MARLNTHLSATPQTRASTVDSLYRDPSVGPQNGDNERTSSYSVLSPSRSSDKENKTPGMREKTPRGKSGGLRGASARMPTPDSGSTSGNGSKRRRTDNYSLPQSQVYEDGQDEEEQEEEGDDLEAVDTPTQTQPDNDDEEHSRFYDPHQDPEVRRRLRANMRDHARLLEDNRNDLIQSRNSGLLDILKTQNSLFGKVRQTADATVDSRFLVNASDLAGKKLNNSLGNSATGIDLDQFVSKCIYFMKSGGYVAGEENAPVIPVGDDDNEDPDGLDWALLGRQACFPCNKRPPTSAFLLGPLSVQKRVRTTQRKARSQRQPLGPATRPQEITQNDTQQSEANNLTNLVKGIRKRLTEHITQNMDRVEEELGAIPDDELTDEDQSAALRRHRMAMTEQGEPAVSLLDFAINPKEFGQTVENLFYISFLVREGNAKIVKDEAGLPLLLPAQPRGVSEQREDNVQKHQAVFSLDYPSWQMFIQAFDIRVPLIPHRESEQTSVGSNGWYNG
ncbi:Nse4 domain containing protein [Pyrenophora tritici-repentis]|uniref:Non-structural maintenance of chromosomes element 4 n=1 Tax=Pyrenophora tritici-repentis TaxID=45151 RepID=A0A922SWQ5_9PLEO|nr:Nse4 C-terminal [Pyrenophora tritici-repentis]KAI1524024.1 Nse4 domain containing protein [Pyrenophora tritici-repentis]KAI1560376.1 Nse4 domain containing protein [Pyrenophora tritici-repentis]KAI1593948.1 Nse4 domain containing protein [Pyrenophora tritici-repentis]